ncbi:hypothetical protein O3P69_002287, partial [Scylla paramamosain]
MPLPRRSPRSTPRASASTVPRSLMLLLQQARKTITDQQQAITTLQADMAALTARGASVHTPRVPPSAAPEKCDLEMAPAAWDRTGLVVEGLAHRQYTVRLDGSGRISLRNRKHLRPTLAPTPPVATCGGAGQDASPPHPQSSPSPKPATPQPPRPRRQA